ncbi:GntR family transcriptional regulator [Paenibacillus sp. FSL R7-0273]|uniref:GntR family transcriptional regulator n=1 Tax=Paenibacillus sp. FSL R7-0273 TaxID=1536772 RepID=UPI000B0B9B23|nr:GntR family transcriptional regulator [Paenibacillus sp. FSL R7-0273]
MRKKPLYQKIYQQIKEDIQNGKYKPGEQIPTEKELMELFEVSRLTAKNAMNLMAEEGWINRVSGKGSFVSELAAQPPAPAEARSSRLIGLILAGFSDSYGTELLRTIISELNQKGYHCILKISNESQELETEYLDELIAIGVEGIIILPVQAEFHNPALLKVTLSNFPVVLMDRKLAGLSVPYVGSNNKEVAGRITSQLLTSGHHKICVISHNNVNNSSINDRIDGIKEAYMSNQVLLDTQLWLLDLETSYWNLTDVQGLETDYQKIYQKIAEKPEITCFFALDYLSGQILWNALERAGRKIPEDYSLLGFDGPPDNFLSPSYSRIIQNQKEIAVNAADLLIQLISSKQFDSKEMIISTHYLDNQTVRSLAE